MAVTATRTTNHASGGAIEVHMAKGTPPPVHLLRTAAVQPNVPAHAVAELGNAAGKFLPVIIAAAVCLHLVAAAVQSIINAFVRKRE